MTKMHKSNMFSWLLALFTTALSLNGYALSAEVAHHDIPNPPLLEAVPTTSVHVDQTFSKVFEERFTLLEGGKVDIENIHGTVDIDTWDASEVEIVVTVEVDASSEAKANSTFERINVSFSNGDRYVSAETEIDSKKSFWWFVQSWWGEDDVRINYQVRMPKSANLEISNKYGDIDIEDIDGEVSIDQKYGNLGIAHAANDLELSLGYGHAVINRANRIKADIQYYKLRVDDANVLEIDSKYSGVTIESANRLSANSAYDGYHLGDIGVFKSAGKYDKIDAKKIEELEIVSKYTHIDIDELTIGLDAQLSYGGLEVDHTHPSVTRIRVESRYVDIDIDTEALQDFTLDILGRYVKVSLPDDLQLTRDLRENNEIEAVGYFGSAGSSTSFKFDADYGKIRLR